MKDRKKGPDNFKSPITVATIPTADMWELLLAAHDVLESWDTHMNGPKRGLPRQVEEKKSWEGVEYWSPAGVIVESGAMNRLRLILEKIEPKSMKEGDHE